MPPRCAYTAQAPLLFSETLQEKTLMGLPEDRVDTKQPCSWQCWNKT